MFLLASSLAGQGFSYYKIYLFHILLVISFFKDFSLVRMKQFLVNQKPLVYMAIFSCFSIIWSTNKSLGVRDISYMIMGILCVYLIGYSETKLKELLKVVCYVTFVNLFISIGEALDLFRYPVSQFSPYAEILGKKYINTPFSTSVPTGLHSNPNNNALWFVIFSPIVLTYLTGWQVFLYLFLATFVIIMATSKLMLLAWILLLVILVFGFLRKKVGFFKAAVTFVTLALIVMFSLSISSGERLQKYSRTIPSLMTFGIQAPQNFVKRLSGEDVKFDFNSIDRSLQARLTYIDGVASVINKNWFLGAGAGSLDGIYNEQVGFKLSMKNPHFYFLEIAAKYGLVFLIVYLFWLYNILKKVSRVNMLYGVSIMMFILFNPVIASASYFIPKWGLYGLMLKISRESINKHSY